MLRRHGSHARSAWLASWLLGALACDADRSSVVDEPTESGEDTSPGDTGPPAGEPPPSAPGGYYVLGNRIYDAEGRPHRFQGVARPSLEWNPQGEMLSPDDYQRMASWGANVVRLAINQGFWLEGSVVHDPEYPARIDQNIAWAHDAGLDVILDLHWSDRGDPSVVPDQQRMADERSRALWAELAARYRDDGRVLFELYNEPHDVIWGVWRDGGPSGDGFTAIGMQALYDEVRAQDAHNLVLVGGLDWAFDLSRVDDFRLDGHNIVYVSHPYDFPNKQPEHWDLRFGQLAQTDAVMLTEFGSFDCSTDYTETLLDYADERGISWVAWAWFPGGCEFPGLIDDWSGTPSAVGRLVRERMGG